MSFDQDKAFEADQGFLVSDASGFFSGVGTPLGSQAPVGSLYLQNDTAQVWKKFGSGVNDWEIFKASNDLARTNYPLIHNSTLSNGQAIRWSNLTNNSKVIVSQKSALAEVSFSNVRANADADFRFYRNTVSPGNLFFTWTAIRNTKELIATSLEFQSNPTFNAGDSIEIVFDDRGRNPLDMVMTLSFQSIE